MASMLSWQSRLILFLANNRFICRQIAYIIASRWHSYEFGNTCRPSLQGIMISATVRMPEARCGRVYPGGRNLSRQRRTETAGPLRFVTWHPMLG